MTTMLSNAQNNGLLANGWVQPISYNGTEQVEHIERMEVFQKENNRVECRIDFKGRDPNDNDFWSFELQNTKIEDNIATSELHGTVMFVSYAWGYHDSNASGTLISDLNTGIETLHIYIHIYQGVEHYTMSWKAFEYQPVGKTYKAFIQETGDVLTYRMYHVLHFIDDKRVIVREHRVPTFPSGIGTTITEKTHLWEMYDRNQIVIYASLGYGTLQMQGTGLAGWNADKKQRIWFEEITENDL